MKDGIQRDLSKIERRESHLWFLVLSMLIGLGAIVAGPFSLSLLRQVGNATGLSDASSSRLAAGLFFLIMLFCLYTMHTLLLNARMKGLLAEMNRAAASSMELDDFLPSIAQKIAAASNVNLCRIALFDVTRTGLRLVSDHSDKIREIQPDIGRSYAWDELVACKQAVETKRPLLLRRRHLDRLRVGTKEIELITGDMKRIRSILIVPMTTQDRVVGLVILGRSAKFTAGRFAASTVARAQALARHAGAAIDQAQLKREAIHDPLTNLYNRRHFSERLREELYRADRHTHLAAILLCDLDRFKTVNDTLGHQAGDNVLKAVAEGIQESTRETDLVFRWGGDEIVVILSETSRQGTLTAAERIREAVRKATPVDIDVSIGIALYPEHGKDEDELIRTADKALYIAKKSGEHVRIGEEDYQLDRQTIKVVFQPVVEVATNRIMGYEALTRDPEGKLSAPQFFEKYRLVGRINELKELTLRSQITAARDLGLERVFTNVDFCVLSQLEPIPKPPNLDVVLELSEREALNDLENHLTVTRRWREHGYRFALDDFGAGFISLPFSMLVPDYVKVDRSTVLQAVASETFRHFLDRLLGAVRTYASEGIVAEGIERAEELQLVKDLGIALVQGYMFGKPQELTAQTVRIGAEVKAVAVG